MHLRETHQVVVCRVDVMLTTRTRARYKTQRMTVTA